MKTRIPEKPRTLTFLCVLSLLPACFTLPEDETPAEDLATAGQGLVAHVYSRPPLPTAYYEPPTANAVFVAPGGNDATGSGTEAQPYQTLGRALQVVNAKPADATTWTVVLKAGTYREGELTVSRAHVTVQRYKSDVVSLRGSVAVTGFSGSGPYTQTLTGFDPTPVEADCADTVLLGQAGRDYGSETPFAVTRAGIPLRRVAPGAALSSGQYRYDAATNVLTLADSPTEVEVALKRWALKTNAPGVKFAGLDVQNYATCTVNWSRTVNGLTYYKGAVLLYRDSESDSGAVLENSTVANNAANGVGVAHGRDIRLSGNVLVNNGWTGAQASNAQRLIVDNNVMSYNNVRRWANTVEAGMKVTFIRDGVVFNNLFEHNAANGFWCDQGCGATDPGNRWFVLARNVARYNDDKGLFYEVSHHGVLASNLVHDNGRTGIAVFGSRDVQLWNNTAVDNDASSDSYSANISIVDDKRCFTGDTVPGGKACTTANGCDPQVAGNYDHCEPSSVGPLANTCNAEAVVLMNNILSGSLSARPLLNVEDPNATAYGAPAILQAHDFQAYYRASTGAPATLIRFQRAANTSAASYASLTAFRTANPGREPQSVERGGGTRNPFFVNAATKNFTQDPASTDVWGRGQALPSEVLKAVYWPRTAPAQPSARIGAIEWRDKTVAAPCAVNAPVHHRRNPTSGDHLFTTMLSEAEDAARDWGYTDNLGVAFLASTTAATGLSPVYRLYSPTVLEHFWTIDAAEKQSAQSNYGYTQDEGIGFHAATASGPCWVPVYRLVHAATSRHTFTTSQAERASLVAGGWTDEGIKFHAGAPQ
ncbi:right-handed parallel beta-helix repeat-containing protein [Corallococcus sp. CA047B]|uniref:right-handed parallel beta-helix repeat-containing protein n=1 Tax=Corallococcus sp. CA047B TaxID=2316729 RepID=UPI0011C43DC1|nr:right-handed parallel beta-helix repeat-containing protein [Corallococcus sp. CA047B]